MSEVKTFLILTVAAPHFAIVAGRIGTNKLIPAAQFSSRDFK